MRTYIALLLVIVVLPAFGQKLGNGYGVSDISTQTAESRMLSQIRSMNRAEPIGSMQFRNDYTAGWDPVYFEIYPNPAHNWLAADFPPNRNIRFIRILNVAGQVVETYHMWDRQFYIGHLQSGMYVVQFVQNNFMAHSTPFFKR
jgi:hypothetical protein